MKLLTRDQFREAVFARDKYKCVNCGAPAVDAHHLIERKAWGSSGGYYLNNGVAVCEECHWKAEKMEIDVEELRISAGIDDIILPIGMTGRIDKWANEILEDGRRIPGPLFNDTGFRKCCSHLLYLFVCEK